LAGRGAKITRAAIEQGIEITLVAAWRAPLSFEKRLKAHKEAARICPVCCRARRQKVKRVVPVLVEQLALPFEADVEPWPVNFEFPDPPSLPMDRYEFLYYRRWARPAPRAIGDADLL
jgi:hypothetical protein